MRELFIAKDNSGSSPQSGFIAKYNPCQDQLYKNYAYKSRKYIIKYLQCVQNSR